MAHIGSYEFRFTGGYFDDMIFRLLIRILIHRKIVIHTRVPSSA